MVGNHFGINRSLENRSRIFKFPTESRGVYQIAIVGKHQRAFYII